MTRPDPLRDELDDVMAREQMADRHQRQIDDYNDRLAMLGQLLTCAVVKLGGEMAVTKTEIERAIQGQQLALTPLPHDRGFYVALTTTAGGSDVSVPAPSDVPAGPRSRT